MANVFRGDKPPDPNCTKCQGKGWWQYDHNHSTICDKCCPHDQGFWLLEKHYGTRNGKWCCRGGCGFTRDFELHDGHAGAMEELGYRKRIKDDTTT